MIMYLEIKKNPINKSYFTRQWEKYKKESGLNITAHQLRHTYATILFEADIKDGKKTAYKFDTLF